MKFSFSYSENNNIIINNNNSSWVKEGDGKRFMDVEFQEETEPITVGHIEAYS